MPEPYDTKFGKPVPSPSAVAAYTLCSVQRTAVGLVTRSEQLASTLAALFAVSVADPEETARCAPSLAEVAIGGAVMGRDWKREAGLKSAEAMTPSRIEVTRAKRAVIAVLSDCEPHAAAELADALALRDAQKPTEPRFQVANLVDVPGTVTRDHPLMMWHRLRVAGAEAVAELAATAVILPYLATTGTPPPTAPQRIDVKYNGGTDGFETVVPIAALQPAYRLTQLMRAANQPWWLVGDLLVEGLTTPLPDRSRRCLDEALMAYRQGLFLSALNLLGAAVEGAWIAAAGRLRNLDSQLAENLDEGQTSISKIQKRAVEVIAEQLPKGRRWQAHALAVHAELVRKLRNYGAHPGDDDDPALDRYFEESTTGTVVLATHGHLLDLDRVIAEIEGRIAPSGG